MEVFWGPTAYAIIGGLFVATLLTLLFLPALYVAWFRIKEPRKEPEPRLGAGVCGRQIRHNADTAAARWPAGPRGSQARPRSVVRLMAAKISAVDQPTISEPQVAASAPKMR